MGHDYGLCLLDPTYKLYGPDGKENDAGDAAQLLNAVDALAVHTGASIAYSQHFSKGNQAGKESIDRVSGSGVWARDPDSIITLTAHEDEDCFAVECTLRAFKPIDAFGVRWAYPVFARDNDIDPAKLKKAAGRAREYTEAQLLDVLGKRSLTTAQWQEQAQEEHGMSTRTFHTLKKALEKSGRILKSKTNDKWQRINSK
jgi:hypothetical protein